MYVLHEVDAITGEVFGPNVARAETKREARRKAMKLARAWCEGETPGFVEQTQGTLCIGDADFGILIRERK